MRNTFFDQKYRVHQHQSCEPAGINEVHCTCAYHMMLFYCYLYIVVIPSLLSEARLVVVDNQTAWHAHPPCCVPHPRPRLMMVVTVMGRRD